MRTYLFHLLLFFALPTVGVEAQEGCQCDLNIHYEDEQDHETSVKVDVDVNATSLSKLTSALSSEGKGSDASIRFEYDAKNSLRPVSERTTYNRCIRRLGYFYCALLAEQTADFWGVEKCSFYWSPRYKKIVAKIKRQFSTASAVCEGSKAAPAHGLLVRFTKEYVIIQNPGPEKDILLSAQDQADDMHPVKTLLHRHLPRGETTILRSDFELMPTARLEVNITTSLGEYLLSALE